MIDLGVSLVLAIVLLVYCGLPECRFWLFWFGIFGLLESLDICLILLLVILALIAKFVGFSGVVTGCLVGGLWRLPIYCGVVAVCWVGLLFRFDSGFGFDCCFYCCWLLCVNSVV